MSRSEQDATRTVRLWLEEGVTALPDWVLDAVIDQLPATPQRQRSPLAWRLPIMNNTVRLVLAAAAVVVVALIGYQLVAAPNVGSPGVATPTPAPSPTSLTGEGTTTLTGGTTYVAGTPFPYGIGFEAPSDGWTATIGGPYAVGLYPPGDDVNSVSATIFDNVAEDPCAGAGNLNPAPGPSVDNLVNALMQMPGVQVTDAGDSLVDIYSGWKLTLTTTDDYAQCTLGSEGYVIWTLPLGATVAIPEGGQVRARILDVDGPRMVVTITEAADVSTELRAQMDALVDAMTIDPLP